MSQADVRSWTGAVFAALVFLLISWYGTISVKRIRLGAHPSVGHQKNRPPHQAPNTVAHGLYTSLRPVPTDGESSSRPTPSAASITWESTVKQNSARLQTVSPTSSTWHPAQSPAAENSTQEGEQAGTRDVVIIGDQDWAGVSKGARWVSPLPVRPDEICQYHVNVTCHLRHKKHRILVLLWNTIFGQPLFTNTTAVANFQCCDGVVWAYTANRNLLTQADIVEFHLRDFNPTDMPTLEPWQLVSVFTAETDQASPKLLGRGINVLRSYRLDATLHHGFEKTGSCYTANVTHELEVPLEGRSSTPMAAVVRNCASTSGREHLLRNLNSRMPVHSYGSCMHNKHIPDGQDDWGLAFVKQYTFLFSVENRLCRGYITEKWYRNFLLGTIPVVASYEKRFPGYASSAPAKGSYVNVFDYRTVSDLAAHLKAVSESQDMFDSYHSFRREGGLSAEFLKTFGATGDPGDPGGFCALSKRMMDPAELRRLQERHLQMSDISDCVRSGRILSTIPD